MRSRMTSRDRAPLARGDHVRRKRPVLARLLAERLAVDELPVALPGRHLVDHPPQVVVDRIAGEQAGPPRRPPPRLARGLRTARPAALRAPVAYSELAMRITDVRTFLVSGELMKSRPLFGSYQATVVAQLEARVDCRRNVLVTLDRAAGRGWWRSWSRTSGEFPTIATVGSGHGGRLREREKPPGPRSFVTSRRMLSRLRRVRVAMSAMETTPQPAIRAGCARPGGSTRITAGGATPRVPPGPAPGPTGSRST